MPNKYWLERTEANKKVADKLAASHLQRLKAEYRRVLNEVDLLLSKLYNTMLTDGGISTTNLYKAGRWLQLKAQIERELQATARYQITQAQTTLEAVYEATFKQSYIDINSSLRWGFANKTQMKQVIDSVWSGKHFSNRIWNNTDKLAYRIEKDIKDLIGLGKMPNQIKQSIMQDFKIGLYEADRLIRTEAMYQYNQATATAYQNAGVKQYQFLAATDERTSDKCREMNGKIINFSDAIVGVNMCPLHPNCRSTIIPIIKL